MKWFLIVLAIGLTASEKLDRTYLPPPGAEFSGGNPDDIQLPFEPPNLPKPGVKTIIPGHQDFGSNGQAVQAPVTTTSYAFTQTTTYPPTEGYETTALPINPVTGLPIQVPEQQNYQQYPQNLPGVQNQVTTPGYIPSPLIPEGSGTPSINIGYQSGNQPQNQFVNQRIGSMETGNPLVEGFNRHPDGLSYDQMAYHRPGINVINPESRVHTTGTSPQAPQGPIQYPGQVNGEQVVIPSTSSPQGIISIGQPGVQPSQNEQQGSFSPINVQHSGQPHYNNEYQNQDNFYKGAPLQQPFEDQSIVNPGKNIYEGQHYNRVPSSTTAPGYASSTLAYPINHPERPQASADRNAVILNYENVRTPNGYSYSYDTSNGIHADESGIVDDGTKAQGSYSYIGDDGKVYSVIYTADENGFQPRGDHLPTPPPIPEAIQKVIEQAARDKAAGIFDDGSYDENKYGDKHFKETINHQPQMPTIDNNDSNQATIGRVRKPIAGITGDDYSENEPEEYLDDNVDKTGTIRIPSGTKKYNSDKATIPEGNRRISTTHNSVPTKGKQDEYPEINKGTPGRIPVSGNDNSKVVSRGNYNEQENDFAEGDPSEPANISNTEIQYPGSQIEDADDGLYTETEESSEPGTDYDNIEAAEEDNDESAKPIQTLDSTSTRAPIISNRHKIMRHKMKGNRPMNKKYFKGRRPQIEQTTNQDNIDDYDNERKNKPFTVDNNGNQQIPDQETIQQFDENGYHYNSPQTKAGKVQFPTRFKGQEEPSGDEPIEYKTSGKGTTPKPFITPDIYDEQSNSNTRMKTYYSTTRKPFTTPSAIISEDDAYTDYEDGEDSNQETEDEGFFTTKAPSRKTSTSRRPYQPITTTLKPYTPSGQRTRVTQKNRVRPGAQSEYPKFVKSDYSPDSTTITPNQSHRFSTEIPTHQHHYQPTPTGKPSSITAVGRPVSSKRPASGSAGHRHRTHKPSTKYSTTTVMPEYLTSQVQSGSRLPSAHRKPTNRQPTTVAPIIPDYQTGSGQPSTIYDNQYGYQYHPGQSGYSTAKPHRPTAITSEYHPSSDSEHSGQPTSVHTEQNGYHYGPGLSGYSTTVRPQRPTTTTFLPTSSAAPISTSGQNFYEQDPKYPGTTAMPPNRKGTFILSGPGNTQYGSTTPSYPTTVVYSTPETIHSGLPATLPTSSSRYEYGPTESIYSTASPFTIGTTPQIFVPSTSPGLIQEYQTTQHPIGTTQGTIAQHPVVDGFGRPITFEPQQGFGLPGQAGVQHQGPQFIGGQDSGPGYQPAGHQGPSIDIRHPTSQPGHHDQPKFIGEDFSGPKQQQRFDPETGYHY